MSRLELSISYNLYRCDRQGRRGGGVCLFIRDDLSAEIIGTFDNGVCELLVVKVHSLDTVVAAVYRPPEFSPVLGELDKLLSDLSSPAPAVCLLGDFNFPSRVMSWPYVDGQLVPSVRGHRAESAVDGVQERLQAERLCNLALKHHIVQLIDQPTHGMEILDLFYCSDQHLVSHISTEDQSEL